MNSIPERIRTYRKSLGLTQEELAKELKVSTGSVAMWETGKRNPPIRILCELGIVRINDSGRYTNTYKEVFDNYCELPNFDKGVLFAMICAEREESCI